MPDSIKAKLRDKVLDFFSSKCTDTSQLISESMDHEISGLKQFKVNFHLALCEFCCRYKEQLETMRAITIGLKADEPEVKDSQLNDSAKEKLKKLIAEDE
ncbi:MAG: hypothetical protein ACQ9MH_12460 [Nitrospinales bacterium]